MNYLIDINIVFEVWKGRTCDEKIEDAPEDYDAEIKLIKAPKDNITLMADAVWIQGAGLSDPYRPVGTESCSPIEKP